MQRVVGSSTLIKSVKIETINPFILASLIFGESEVQVYWRSFILAISIFWCSISIQTIILAPF